MNITVTVDVGLTLLQVSLSNLAVSSKIKAGPAPWLLPARCCCVRSSPSARGRGWPELSELENLELDSCLVSWEGLEEDGSSLSEE